MTTTILNGNALPKMLRESLTARAATLAAQGSDLGRW